MKKIIYIANARIPTEKAHGIQIMKMCEAFADTGVKVELVLPWRINNIQKSPYIYYGVKRNFKIKKLPCLDLIRFGRMGFYIQSLTFAFSSFFYALLQKSDIIYSRDEPSLYFLSFFKKNLIWETHTAKNHFLIKRVLIKTEVIISISQGLKDFYVKNSADSKKIFVVPDGVDLKDFDIEMTREEIRQNLGLPLDRKIIGYVGKYKTMGEEKGVDELIEAFSGVVVYKKNAFLLLVGINKDEISEITSIFNKFKISSREYKIVSHIPRIEVPYYLKASDILIMSYPNKEHYAKYMSPLKLFEYMASGTPIVSTDLPSVREVLNDKNAVLVNPDNVLSLKSGIEFILSSNSIAKSISNESILDVQKYTWSIRAKNILNFTSL